MKNTRTLRADIPNDVWDRFAEEARAKGITVGTHLRQLLVARDKKRTRDSSIPSNPTEGEQP